MKKIVGIVGLGIMGGAIARNPVDRGWRVLGFDIDPAPRAEMAMAGIIIVSGAGQIAREAPIILTSLPSPEAVHLVAQEIAASAQHERIVAELSTLRLADKLSLE
jgi:L-threonate 2-dehydrogenase